MMRLSDPTRRQLGLLALLLLLSLTVACGGASPVGTSGGSPDADTTAVAPPDEEPTATVGEEPDVEPTDGDTPAETQEGTGNATDPACALVGPDVVEAALGVPVAASNAGPGCEWQLRGESADFPLPDYAASQSIVLRWLPDVGAETFTGHVDAFQATETIEGLGDEAAWAPGIKILIVRDGDDVYQVQSVLWSEDSAAELAVARAIAEAALAAQ